MSTENPALTVLVVEDEWLLRDELAQELRDAGCTVIETAKGEEAVSLLKSQGNIDVLITDIQLAGKLDGWDVAEAARAQHPQIPVIYASGNSGNNPRRVKPSRFFSKPWIATELLRAARDLWQNRGAGRMAGRLARA